MFVFTKAYLKNAINYLQQLNYLYIINEYYYQPMYFWG